MDAIGARLASFVSVFLRASILSSADPSLTHTARRLWYFRFDMTMPVTNGSADASFFSTQSRYSPTVAIRTFSHALSRSVFASAEQPSAAAVPLALLLLRPLALVISRFTQSLPPFLFAGSSHMGFTPSWKKWYCEEVRKACRGFMYLIITKNSSTECTVMMGTNDISQFSVLYVDGLSYHSVQERCSLCTFAVLWGGTADGADML
ncbi:eukaryotic translation initiation factor-like [Leishmania tarentolae]|uniref:Eukaryotic translation initiation factor-like n=1 Tax=Leishmania tarentolae TaxID=5689 RepID=A0A640KJR4_LEITA|nr:eukaryotic translation initiation factor-like [Leishmania tarentolae]